MSNKFSLNTANEMSQAIRRARADMHTYLTKHFPIGARCEVLLSVSQKKPTPATICGVEPGIYGGEVVVEIDTTKQRSRQRRRSVSTACVSNVQRASTPEAAHQPTSTPADDSQKTKPLTRCAAARDGDCTHAQCPQLRDNEPHATGRHCPLDT